MVLAGEPEMARARPKNGELLLRLYIAGHAPNSILALANARAICDEHFASCYKLEIIDLLQDPDRAIADGIFVTPTLLKVAPLPAQKIVGNLADKSQVVLALGGT